MSLLAWFDWLPLLRGPAPYPEEWRWLYREGVPTAIPWTGLACSCAITLLLLGSDRGLSPRRLLCAATALGVVLQVALLGAVGERSGVGFMIHRVLNPGFTSYFTVAISSEAADVPDLLAHYSERMQAFETEAPHAGTKPPGAVLYYRGLFALCRAAPWLSDSLVAIATGSDPRLQSQVYKRGGGAGLATAFLGPVLLVLLCALTCFPVAALSRTLGAEAMESARIGALWTILPGPTLMTPVMDQGIAWLVACATALLAAALTGRRTRLAAALAGAAAATAILISYGSAVFLCIGAAAVVALGLSRLDARALSQVMLPCLLFIASAAAVLLLPALFGFRHVENFQAAMQLHFEHYTSPRSYWTWLLFNPWDLAVFLGFPVALLLVRHIWQASRGFVHKKSWPSNALVRVQLVTGACLVAVLLSGAIRGEVGRLFVPLMPLLLVAALLRRHGDEMRGPGAGEAGRIAMLLLVTDLVLRSSWRLP
jgi:hypothetical protein